MRRQRKTRLRQAVAGPDISEDAPDRPTPQTAAKLRQDVVGRLLARGRLAPCHAEVAEEIRRVHEAIGRGMFPSSQAFMWTGGGGNRGRPRDFLDRMTERERDAWERRYIPWSRAMATDIAAGLVGTRWLQLVIDVVVDNATLREVETRYRLRHGAALGYLIGGLERYGRLG